MRTTIRISGGPELERSLKELPKATAKNVVRRVLRNAAQPIADLASEKAPEDTGKLKRSLTVSTKLSKAQRKKHRKRDPNDIEVFAGVSGHRAATHQEFGTSRNKAQPYLRPAWDSLKRGALEKILSDMRLEIDKALARRARKIARGG